MALSQAFSGTATISTTEISLVSGTSTLQSNTTAGIYQVLLELNNLTSTESYQLRIKEKVISSATQRVIQDVTITGAQTAEPIYVTPALHLMHGWDVTLTKLQGTDRSISWSIRSVA